MERLWRQMQGAIHATTCPQKVCQYDMTVKIKYLDFEWRYITLWMKLMQLIIFNPLYVLTEGHWSLPEKQEDVGHV